MRSLYHYNRKQLAAALREVGIRSGDIVFSHVSVGMLGSPEEGTGEDVAHQILWDAFWEVLGPEGTWIVPTYSYSYCKNQIFNPLQTPSSMDPFTNFFRSMPAVRRSLDPIFSVAGKGPRAGEMIENLPNDCFGEDCVFDRLIRLKGKICDIGGEFQDVTFIHYVEQMHGVPYRYKKLFSGQMLLDGKLKRSSILCSAPVDRSHCDSDLQRLKNDAFKQKLVMSVKVGRSSVICASCQDLWDLCSQNIKSDPWYLARGPAVDLFSIEKKRTERKQFRIEIPPKASMMDIIRALWKLPRDIVSDGYDDALDALAAQVPMTIHRYPTGLSCWTWVLPEKWTCEEAYLETMQGKRLLDYRDNPLHLVSYSLPFAGEVSRDELFAHLYVDRRIPDAIPFKFKYYDQDWGLCCTQRLKESLSDDRYRVMIRTRFEFGTLKVGEVLIPGRSDRSFVLCAHLCHPHMVNDNISAVAVGLDVIRELQQRKNLYFTYRYLVLPETIGAVAYLSQNEILIPNMIGGLSLFALGLDHPFGLQLSYSGNTQLDQCFKEELKRCDPNSWFVGFPSIMGNDERQFNAPGVRVPMLSLSRIVPEDQPHSPYYGYHSSYDEIGKLSVRGLEESKSVILRLIEKVEENADRLQRDRDAQRSAAKPKRSLCADDPVPLNLFKGEVFLSRFAMHVDWYSDRVSNKILFDVMHAIDGTRSLSEISAECRLSFDVTKKIVDEFCRNALVRYQ
ncbi:MAG: DUF4910 domain-containing protein [Candidatus Omnitrophica bacterium]|nr:DUF4910 domain-containing protein [Candidatus Omnitrophota bacterium]